CCVPNCGSTVGVLFPEDTTIKSKWLEALNIEETSLDPEQFVCLGHFNHEDLIENEVRVKEGVIPLKINTATYQETKDSVDVDLESENENTFEKEAVTDEVQLKTKNKEADKAESETAPAEDTIPSKPDLKICRLCMEEKQDSKNIYEEKIENIPVFVAIMECIYPIEILSNDKLSKEICFACFECINNYFKFRSLCLENDKKQRDKHREGVKSPSTGSKRKPESSTGTYTVKKPRVLEILTDSEDDYDYVDTLPGKSEVDEKIDIVEEELRRVLEGQLTEEQAKAENIIIHIQDDEEEQSPEPPQLLLSKLKLPIVIKPVETMKATSTTGKTVVPTQVKTRSSGVVTLPQGIRIRENYISNMGRFEGVPVSYVFGMEFLEVDGYLFEYRLSKGSIRYLGCVIPACKALAIQNRIKPNLYNLVVTVERPHNHKPPDDAEKKKQMFYYVMKHKMQCDKTLNFRSIYDEVCKHDPEISELVPLRNVINEICRHQLTCKPPPMSSFEQFYNSIEDDTFQKLHFTHNGVQFYQERFTAADGARAVVFANVDIIEQVSHSNLMYIDASFKIDTGENFKYQLMTVLVWIDDSYLHDTLAPSLRPREIVTDYEGNLYYALGETYLDSAIGGSVFYYTQNLYKKVCGLNLSRDLETNPYFRNVYHMLLMLPLLPVNTILDGLNNIEIQARDLGLSDLTKPIFDHIHSEWINKVTPDLFCVHRLENRINENVIAPFKKLRDLIMLSKGKAHREHTTIVTVVEKLIELEHFLQVTYSTPNKKSFARDLSSSQKKNVLKAWGFIESHPKININNFFSKVLGYIKCMENQLWIWGFYRYDGDASDDLINAANFSITDVGAREVRVFIEGEGAASEENDQLVMEAVIDENGGFVVQNGDGAEQSTPFETAFLKYVYKE
ncbi:hypothetical protein NQ315_001527, partial [Exocentrus adspersus]